LANIERKAAAAILGAVGIHNVIKSEEFQLNYAKSAWKVWCAFVVSCLILTGIFAIPLSPKPETPVPIVEVVTQQPDYIEGTEVTRNQLEQIFCNPQ
jgi:hypothetical protein